MSVPAMAFICRKQTSSVLFASLSSNFSPMQGIKLRPTERAWATFSPINCTHSPTLLFLLLFIYYTKAAKQHQSKTGDIQYTKERKKAIHRNKTIKSVKHLHIIAAKMFPKYSLISYSDAETRLSWWSVDSVFLKCANESLLSLQQLASAWRARLLLLSISVTRRLYADKQVARQADTNSRTVKVSHFPTNKRWIFYGMNYSTQHLRISYLLVRQTTLHNH